MFPDSDNVSSDGDGMFPDGGDGMFPDGGQIGQWWGGLGD